MAALPCFEFSGASGSTLLAPRPCILFYPQPPRRSKSACDQVFARQSQANVGCSHLSPGPTNRGKNFGQFADEICLLFRREHQVPVALVLRSEGSEDPASYTKVGCSHVRAFLRPFKAQSNSTEICWIHPDLRLPTFNCFVKPSQSEAESDFVSLPTAQVTQERRFARLLGLGAPASLARTLFSAPPKLNAILPVITFWKAA